MTFDGLTLAAMAEELNARLSDGRVQKVVQPDLQTVALEVYARRERTWLLLSADPRRPRVYLAAERPGRGVENPTPLLLLLRKHVQGRRVGSIRQPSGERILWVDLDAFEADESTEGSPLELRLIIEAISQYSNLILVDSSGVVMDAARRISAEQNRTRVTLPHHPYLPPPPRPKHSLSDTSPEALREALDAAAPGTTVGQSLVAAFAGLGPLAGREITFRAVGDARAKVPVDAAARSALAERLSEAAGEVVRPVQDGSFVASIAREGESIVAFAPYPLTHLSSWEPRGSLSLAAEEFYRQEGSVRAVDIARRAALAALAVERSQADKKRDSLLRALEATARADDLRLRGELLLTHATAIPRGAARFRVDGVDLELDPRLTAVENAQALFRRYRKAKAALREVPALLAETELRLRYLDEVAVLVELADTTEDVRLLRSEIRVKRDRPEAASKKRPARKRPTRRPEQGVLRRRTSDGHELLIGRSAQQNQFVTFELARPDDIWLHAHGVPGSHVILRVADAAPPRAALEEAASVAARYSANRTDGKVLVDWTRKKYVRPLGKGTPGLVTYSNEQTIVARPQAGSEE